MLRFSNLNFSYGDTPIISDFTAEITKGQFAGIVGANGAGKTTLLKLLLGLIKPLSGSIYVNSKNAREMTYSERARMFAYVPQSTDTVFPYKVKEVVMMGRYPAFGVFSGETEEDRAAVKSALEVTQCSLLAERRFNELSGGEKQRVVIARALAQDTPFLILDEPTSNLDIKHQILTYEILSALNRDSEKTVIVVTHDLRHVSSYCGKIIVLKNGRIFAEGEPGAILDARVISEAYGVSERHARGYIVTNLNREREVHAE